MNYFDYILLALVSVFFIILIMNLSVKVFPLKNKKSNVIISIILILISGILLLLNPRTGEQTDLTEKYKTFRANINTKKTKRNEPVEKAIRIVCDYYKYKDITVVDSNIVWLDLSSSATDNEFYISYFYDDTNYIDVFTTKNGGIRNLFHEQDEVIDKRLMANHFKIDNQAYFLYSVSSGNAGNMSFYIYKYNGLNKLKQVFHSYDEFFNGRFWISNDTVFIHGNNQIFIIIQKNNIFKLINYIEKIVLDGKKEHLLSYKFENNKFVIKFDNRIIVFTKGNEPESFNALDTIPFSYDNILVIDDIFPGRKNSMIRTLYSNGDWDLSGKYYSKFKPLKKGLAIINVDVDYGDYYYVPFFIR